jgi:NADPH:quinone reductase-like Zn-dependent oxidoreductase
MTESRFRHALGRATGDPKHGGFQLYTVAHEITVSPIPDSLPYENGVVLPLAISTAAAGLYQKDFLALPYPTVNTKPSGKTILIWGGASSVGSTAIQLAVSSGLEVVSTASKSAYDAISSPETLKATAEIVSQLGGGKIATVLAAPAEGLPSNVTAVGGKTTFWPLYL